MINKNRFSGWLSAVKKGKTAVVPLALLIMVLAVFLTTCTGGAGEETGTFTLVTGSGTVTVILTGAGDYNEATFYYGTASAGYPIGGEDVISGGIAGGTLEGEGNIVFTGGLELEVGGFIDADDSGAGFYMPEDGDLVASKTVTVSGNTTVTLNYPNDFSEPVSGSGTVTVNLVDAGDFEGTNFYFGTISTGTPFGGHKVIADNDDSWPIETEGSVIFTGGLELVIGGFIDVNGNGDTFNMADNGDWLASRTVTVSGNQTVVLTYPDDFTQVTGSGTVSMNLKNAFSDHAGESFFYGTSSTGNPLGDSETIDSNVMLLTIPDNEGEDVEFTGGSELLVGGFIDVNGNGDDFHMADDGDYQASAAVTVSGDTVVTLTY
jgi:hypothetical protein